MKNKMIRVISLVIILTMFAISCLPVYAHESVLNVEYDPCNQSVDDEGDVVSNGEDEMWYSIAGINVKDTSNPENNVYCEYHLNESITTIKYYFEECSELDTNYTWTTDIYKYYMSQGMTNSDAISQAETMEEEIKNAYVASMKKWDDVYYYAYDNNGYRTNHKLINIVEGTKDDHNLSIYPIDYYSCSQDDWVIFASTGTAGGEELLNTSATGMLHRHYTHWNMYVNVSVFFAHNQIEGISDEYDIPAYYTNYVNNIRDIVGAHELGHVLGLKDLDTLCSQSEQTDHHQEVLMGYGDVLSERSTYAKYKDIAGVSITRGFHTDDDHKWMLRINIDGTKDVICSLCNGVRYNVTISANGTYENKQFNIYKSCVHHGGTNEGMLLVATDGVRDFYKCQYCRFIAEVDKTTQKSVSIASGCTYDWEMPTGKERYYRLNVLDSGEYNFKTNFISVVNIQLYNSNFASINQLNSDIYDENGCNVELTEGVYYIKITNQSSGLRNGEIYITPPPHTHEYTEWTYHSPTHHIESCECGLKGTLTSMHVIKAGTIVNLRAPCMYCGAIILIGNDFVQVGPANLTKVTLNGSYILPNGIIVLVDEDIEAYENGTLVWYDKDDLPQTQ